MQSVPVIASIQYKSLKTFCKLVMIMYDIYIVFKTPMGLQIFIFAYRKQRHTTECSFNISTRTKSILFSVNTV